MIKKIMQKRQKLTKYSSCKLNLRRFLSIPKASSLATYLKKLMR